MNLSDFKPGDRIQLHPATDRWMRGDRYGEVVAVGRKKLTVVMDASRLCIRVLPSNVLEIIEKGKDYDAASKT